MVSILVVLTTYFVPLIIIVVCYTLILKHLWNNRLINRREDNIPMNSAQTTSMSNPQERRRKKVTKMVAIVVILFATFWFPIHAYNLCFTLLDNFPLTKTSIDIKVFALTLSYASSFVNPFVYAFMGDGFRRAFRRSFPQVTRGGRIAPGIQSEGGNSASMETRLIESRNPSTRLKAQLVVKVEDVDEEENEDVAETAT
ncbi:hypothetical protein SNE40_023487 [Patella caerulea]|uniref:G-protein coupled receptors family 1 profile domain-containing protein n=1 Tax=Patella caerulea TaxID=87958 RepID=A0AAN8IX20_PATCE